MKKIFKILPLLVGSFLLTPTVGRAAELTDNLSLVNETGIENNLQSSANHQTLPLPDSVSELADHNYEELVGIPDKNQSKSGEILLKQAEPAALPTPNEDHLGDHESSEGGASPSKREGSQSVVKDQLERHHSGEAEAKSSEFGELPNRSELVDNKDSEFVRAESKADDQNENQFQELKAVLQSDEEPITNGQSEEVVEVTVETFEELLRAIEEAKEGVLTRIRIVSNLEITKKIMIPAGKRIILTSNYQQEADKDWEKVKQAADFADQGEARQREIIEEARKRAEEANNLADLTKNPLPDPHRTVQIKRASSFIDDSLFQIAGKLQLGDAKTALHVDGNKEVTTQITKGVLFNVESGGHFILKNGTLMQVNNSSGYSAPIAVENGGRLDMVGGRISSNESYQVKEPWGRPTSAGAVYVNPGGRFNLSNGLIDNNKSSTGGVFVGSLFGGSSDAIMHMTGGMIANNRAVGPYALGGAINGFPRADIQIDDGILAHNQSGQSKSSGWGGGIVMTNQRISPWSNSIGNEYSSIPTPNSKSLREIRARLTLNGGLIANNRANKGGGLYIDSDNVYFNKTMLLDNIAYQFGGGFYVSFPPHAQELNQMLITENKANQGMLAAGIDQANTGGGIWNCPTGYVHIGDGHTVYAFNNQAKNLGDDLRFSKKTGYFKLTVGGKDYYIQNKFYSHVSPLTKGYKEHTTLEIIKFLNDTGHGDSIPDRLSYNASWMALKAIYSKALQAEAWSNAKTFIIGNQASNGGGIGSNANMETPNDEGSYDLELTKKWESQISRSDRKSVTADIFIVPVGTTPEDVRNHYGSNPRYFKYGEVELNEKNDWTQRFSQSQYGRLDQLLEEMKNYGLPYNKNAVNDKGLPFTAAELKAKGFKYLVVERDSHGFISTVKEVEPKGALAPGSKVGQLTIGRPDTGVHSNYQDYWFNSADVHLYYINQQEQAERLGMTSLSEANSFKGQISHPYLSQVTETQFYGTDYKFQAWGESWTKAGYTGFSISENGYSMFLVKNKTGYTLYIPYLMIQDMDSDNQYTGWDIHLGEGQVSEQSPKVEERHQFVITNSKSGDLPVQKTWHKDIPEGKRPKSVTIYLLYKGHRVKIRNDENGNPIYRSLILTAENNWKGSFDQIDPNELAQGNYSIEESASESYDARIKSHFEQEFEFRVHYADSYREGEYDIAVNRHFYPFSGDIKLNLYHEDQLVDSKLYTWKSQSDEYGTFYWMEKEVTFGQGNKKLLLNNYGRDVRVKYYDKVGNTPGRSSYDFHLKRDADGFYSLYVPRLFVNGLPQAMFEVRGTSKENIHGLDTYPLISSLTGKPAGTDIGIELKNYPTIDIQAKKIWKNGQAIDKPQVEMVLKQNGSEINRQLLDLRSNQVVWHNLKKYDEQGNLFIYTVEESFQSDYFKQSNVTQTGNVFTFTNIYEIPKTHFEVKKVWFGGPSVKPTIQLQLFRNGQAYGTVVELLNGQSRYRWDDLSATDEEGNPYVYSVEELAVAGYTSTVGPVEDHQVTITNTYVVPKTHFEVKKVWSGGPSVKPTIQLQLFRNGQAYGTVVELLNGQSRYRWDDLSATDDQGNPYHYSVEELAVAGYTSTVGPVEDHQVTITNTYVVPKTHFEVKKVWSGGPSVKPTIQLQLLRNGQAYGTVVELLNGQSRYRWDDLSATDDQGNPYHYSVEELAVAGYTSTIGPVEDHQVTITNTYVVPKTHFEVKKVWSGGPSVKPTIQLQLFRNGQAYGTVVELLNGQSRYRWDDLSATDDQGNPYHYSVEELAVAGYTSTVGPVEDHQVTITNTYVVPKTHFEVKKVWSGGPSVKPTIQLQLFRNGQAYGTVVELLNGQSRYRWDDLSATDDQGNPYHYSVEELAVAGYTSTIGPVEDHQVTITNTYVVPKTHFEVKKVWSGGPSVKPTIQLQLFRNGQAYGTVVELLNGQSRYRWDDLSATDDQGNPYHYSVEELAVAGYTSTVGPVEDHQVTITNTYVVPKTHFEVKKVWSGGPSVKPTIQLQLFRNGQAYGTVVELLNGQSRYRWDDLSATDDQGNPYHYSVEELAVAGYTSTVGPVEDHQVTITNTYVVPKTHFEVKKVWSGGPSVKPTIQLQLLRNGQAYGTVVELTNGNTHYIWTDLDSLDPSGMAYVYTVYELPVDGYKTLISQDKGYQATIVNTYVIPKTSIHVTKIWQGGPDVKPTITIQLLRNNQVIDQIQLLNGQTSYRWEDLDQIDPQGQTYNYTVRESLVSDYYSSVEGNIVDGFVIRNTFIPPQTPPPVPPQPEIPLTPDKPELPQTGENRTVLLSISLGLILVGLTLLLVDYSTKSIDKLY